ncbi:molecular chaperone HtpG [Oribacterium sp. oral taxon 108]|uniref:molecular chaperone HtpG n=1 Tax=Oribacterium sp. oral taxon 108 TaxID=712414 RepID=UPI00020DD875|nr:molecular chaperone HtpG [Oribacterium sp. oral taxon 108]EGL36250.1 ATPase/histidine kinase/DNA gyrase B/HSP90 domain protein [Oribacterium sp. oral taxon 108 str. F0425]
MQKNGSLSIHSENIFPIIKKWMYSDQDIFVREQISNATDAVTKLEKLSLIGEWTKPSDFKGRVTVTVEPEKKTIRFSDNGIGMTAEEVEKYITQIAFSGATEFIEKYKDKANSDQIIGHFGLGFYSAFMVADKVEIETLSYKEGSTPVHWTCDGGTEYSMTDGEKKEHGTDITLHLNEDCVKYANEWELRSVIEKYCSFMPVEIYLDKYPRDSEIISKEEKLDSDIVLEEIPEKVEKDEKGEERKTEAKLKIEKRPVLLNDTHPLWGESPSTVEKEQYLDFYRKTFHDYMEPLFWIHLNMDYPYNLKGILYFPKINSEYESIEGTIKLYNNQVFIADNIKEVIPEYLLLLKGVIDCPDLPLNVSRSQLQNDGFVKKISDYITKKVAEKLSGMCKTERESYEKYWDDISPFIKYGVLRDSKFAEKMTDYILFKDLEEKYCTLPELKEKGKALNGADTAKSSEELIEDVKEEKDAPVADTADQVENKEEEKIQKVYYVSDAVAQSQYISLFKEHKKEAVYLTERIDQPFITELEAKNSGLRFQRIDADVQEAMKDELSSDEQEKLKAAGEKLEKAFQSLLSKDKLHVKVDRLLSETPASLLSISEESRRMQDMMKMYAMSGMPMGALPLEETLVLNERHPLVQYLLKHEESTETDSGKLIEEQLYDLARIQNAPLEGEAMKNFIARSEKILLELAKEE